ncbi:MAG TPA: DUF1080 domain-containing protein [Candidatus Nitrosopolaris sp.]|nr:DUF1080 domain-containing protein [Candidatus Nitrosopolaris sp.]
MTAVQLSWFSSKCLTLIILSMFLFLIILLSDPTSIRKSAATPPHMTTRAENILPMASFGLYNSNYGRVLRIDDNISTSNNTLHVSSLNTSELLSGSKPILYDNFEGSDYNLSEHEVSPNGKWTSIFNGFGVSGVKTEAGAGGGKNTPLSNNNKILLLSPAISASRKQNHASLVTTTKQFGNFELLINTNTVKQLRVKSTPGPGDAAWVLFRYTDLFHYYWVLLKPTGIELGKKDCNTCKDTREGQIFLFTSNKQKLHFGNWSRWDILVIGNHIVVTVDNKKAIDYIDPNMSNELSFGRIGLYSEDALAYFDNVFISPITRNQLTQDQQVR